MKPGKDIHEIFLFYTPQLMDVYFTYLKNKIQKAVGVTTLLVRGVDLANLHSESHMMDETLFKIIPPVKEELSHTADVTKENIPVETTQENVQGEIDMAKQNKIKFFSKNVKTKQSNKACIINKKAS
jgi:hypothetical protein